MKIKGSKSRPRVAVIGFPLIDEDRSRLEQLFPSISFYGSFGQLEVHTSPLEIDLLIIGDKAGESSNILYKISCISFSSSIPSMLGPDQDSYLGLNEPLLSEELIENDIILSYSRIRDREQWTTSKGCSAILANPAGPISQSDFDKLQDTTKEHAIIKDSHSGYPLAIVFIIATKKIGVAWFPLPTKHKIDWIEAIVNEWSKSFPEKFPHIGDWARQKEWLLAPEIKLLNDIKQLEERKLKNIKEIEGRIENLNKKYKDVLSLNDKGLRKLLTEQGNELVNIVKIAFESFGFTVENMDETNTKGKSKKEDLRITIDDNNSWEAIVEVRGYAKSSGKEGDLQRLNKFAKFYNKEKGEFPDKIIYVVNGPIEFLPPQRPKPFKSNPEFINSIADDDCLVISTINLYRVLQNINKINISDIAKSIVESTGEWKFIPKN